MTEKSVLEDREIGLRRAPGNAGFAGDVLKVYEATCKAAEGARRGEGPVLIECKTYRHKGHSRVDPAKYRPKEEVAEWVVKDPIRRFKERLLQEGILRKEEIDCIEAKAVALVEEAVRFAIESPYPAPEEALDDVYG
jgi:pyruvate dehydrogenase E1 component alpha subunit